MPFSIFITSWFTDKAAKSETKSTLRWSIDQTSRKQRSPVEQRNFAYQQRQVNLELKHKWTAHFRYVRSKFSN